MRTSLVLLRSALQRDRNVLGALCLGLFLFEILLVWLAQNIEQSIGFQALAQVVPSFVRDIGNLLGFDVLLLLSFNGMLALGYFHPVVIACLVATATVIGRGPIGDIETRAIELLGTRPMRRSALAVGALLEVALAAIMLPTAMLLGTLVGLRITGRLATTGLLPYLRLGANAAFVLAALGALFVFLAALSRRARGYTQVAVGFSIASYLLDYVARVWSPAGPLGPLSVFRYIDPLAALTGGPLGAKLAVLGTVAVVAAVGAMIAFERRDL